MATEVFRRRIPITSVAQGTDTDDSTAYETRFTGLAELIVLETVTAGDTVVSSLPTVLGVIAGDFMVGYTASLSSSALVGVSVDFSGQTITVAATTTPAGSAVVERVSLLVFG